MSASVSHTAAAAPVMVGGIFVCIVAQFRSRLRLLWFRPGNRHRARRGSESPLATGTTSGRGVVLATSLDLEACGCGITVHGYCRRRLAVL